MGDPNKPQPCWHVVDADYPKENCEKDFAKTCNKVQPFVGVGDRNMCITFPNNEGVWYKLPGTFGYCGADNCCDLLLGEIVILKGHWHNTSKVAVKAHMMTI